MQLLAPRPSSSAALVLTRLCALLALLAGLLPALSQAQGPGSVDPASSDLQISGGQGKVLSIAAQSDGKALVGGSYQNIDGATNQGSLARLETGGGFDDGFAAGVNGLVNAIAVLPDGKILIAGNFGSVNGSSALLLARLLPDGRLDDDFDSGTTFESLEVNALAVQPDGKILVGGRFIVMGGELRTNLARLEADGPVDPSFNTSTSGTVYSIALQEDGKILIGGDFTNVSPSGAESPTPRSYLARLNADGTVDEGFAPQPNGSVYAILPQPDGKILVGGGFSSLQPAGDPAPTQRSRLARLLPNGKVDADFDPAPVNAAAPHLTSIDTIALQTDGRILVGGSFTELQPAGDPIPTPRNRVARLTPEGSVDGLFNPNANGRVLALALQADGRVLVGGEFGTLQPNNAPAPIDRARFARLVNGGVGSEIVAPNSTRASWIRGGASPEVSGVFFELSEDDGDTWTELGFAKRVGASANWELRGLSLPKEGMLRATGRTAGGQFNASSGVVSTEESFELAPGSLTATRPRAFPATAVRRRSRPQVVRLTNLGGMPVAGLNAQIGGRHRRDFAATRPAPALLLPERSAVSRVTFRPSSAGTRSAQATYRGQGASSSVPLRGRGRRR